MNLKKEIDENRKWGIRITSFRHRLRKDRKKEKLIWCKGTMEIVCKMKMKMHRSAKVRVSVRIKAMQTQSQRRIAKATPILKIL